MELQEWLGQENALGIDIWKGKYQYNNETFEEWLDRVSNGDQGLRQLIAEKKFLFGGRALANRGLNNGSYFNCYSSGYCPDDFYSIMEINKNLGLTYKAQGGQGVSLTQLRPKGTPIGKRYTSDGIIPFLELFNKTTAITSQAGSRKGALLVSLDIRHKQAEEFITIKTEENTIDKANLSLEIDDEFMQAVETYYKTGEVITLHEKREYSGHVVEYDVVPIKLYKLMMQCAYDWAEPGCIFTNQFRNFNLMEFDDEYQVETCNPCCTGDTKILTDEGYVDIIDRVGKPTNIWNGYQYSVVTPQKTGENQELYRIRFSNGGEVRCTPYHKFILKDGKRVEAKDLQIGDRLVKCNYPIINGPHTLNNAYTQGFFSGDGFECADRKAKYISFYGEKKNLSQYCSTITQRESSEIRDTYSVNVDFDKDFVPINYDIKSKCEWLAGIVDSDGGNTRDFGIQITSINRPFLLKIQSMLQTMGVNAVVTLSKKAEFRNIKGKEYECQATYRLVLAASDVRKLTIIGFAPHRIKTPREDIKGNKRYIFVKQIEKLEEREDVYCFTEPINHSGVFNGVITAQCGEQPLAKDFCCNLGSLNLSQFVINEYETNACIDYESLKQAVHIGIRALDVLVDENADNHPLPQQKINSLNYRNIGLGLMGVGTALFKLGLTYGDDESLRFIDDLFSFVFKEAVLASGELAKQKGAFPKYKPCVLKSTIIKNHFSEEEIKELSYYGLRNCSLLSIAPTGLK